MNDQLPKYLHVKVTINGNELYTSGFDENEVVIGRGADCQILLENAGVSRNHAKLVRDDNEIKVFDLNSGNGTFVNGIQVQEAVVGVGDTLRIGKFTLYVKLSSQALAGVQPQSTSAAAEVDSGTVFLRPEERMKILQQSKNRPPQERIVVPVKAQKNIDWKSGLIFFSLGTVFGMFCSWVFGS